ncbi:MAG: hypothetical protein HC906_16660 [Bacteroidales bacterium]|nr:hypothetical protein [Bacteroidales bacterium]
MKTSLPILFMIVLTFGFSHLGKSQGAFDQKKKTGAGVNTSSLNAKHINGAKKQQAKQTSQPVRPLINSSFKKDTSRLLPPDKKRIKSIRYSAQTGLPAFIHTPVEKSLSLKSTNQSVHELCYNYLDELKTELKINDPANRFKINQQHTDRNSKTHIRLDEVYNGIRVYGGQVMVHLDKSGIGELFNGHYTLLGDEVNTQPVLTQTEAIQRAENKLKSLNKTMLKPGSILENEGPSSELVLYKPKKSLSSHVLVYRVVLFTSTYRRWEFFIDARNGDVVHFFENTCFIDGAKTATANDLGSVSRTVNTYQKGSSYYLLDASRPMFNAGLSDIPDNPVGAILTIDMNNTFGENQSFWHVMTNNNIWNNPTAVSAHYNAGVAYEFYRTHHGRNSIDGNGGTIISIINVPDEETGGDLDNAYWNGQFMFYGNGDVGFGPLAGALDVAGHEMTHGVIQNTANLEYEGESGAINESMADIFGALMDEDKDWTIAEDVVKLRFFPAAHSGRWPIRITEEQASAITVFSQNM